MITRNFGENESIIQCENDMFKHQSLQAARARVYAVKSVRSCTTCGAIIDSLMLQDRCMRHASGDGLRATAYRPTHLGYLAWEKCLLNSRSASQEVTGSNCSRYKQNVLRLIWRGKWRTWSESDLMPSVSIGRGTRLFPSSVCVHCFHPGGGRVQKDLRVSRRALLGS